MSLYILDTDHLTLIQRSDAKVSLRFVAVTPDELAASVISYEEQVRGRLAQVKQAQTPDRRQKAYSQLCETQRFYCRLRLLEFTTDAANIYEGLRQTFRHAGKMDLRIAATALALDATLVTRNLRDFNFITNLRLDNWA